MNSGTAFEIEITGDALADIYWEGDDEQTPWAAIEALDSHGIRVLGRPPRKFGPLREKLKGCSGMLCRSLNDDVAVVQETGLPVFVLQGETSPKLEAFCKAVLVRPRLSPRYAFFIGRLERDFAQAREAIRIAVESAAGMEFLWVDDGRHVTNIEGIRERTRCLIQQAEFIVADLTLGVENPIHENPSRAHEVGLAIAYERPLFLSSQEPRRYPYFSIADMQLNFWAREDELGSSLRAWIHSQRQTLARRVYNHSLTSPRIAQPVFRWDPTSRFIGPNFSDRTSHVESLEL